MRDTYELGDYLLIIATDRISAFDVIMPNGIPDKGRVLNLVILDIMMPKIDGFEVCRRVREWSQVPIIMLSTNADETDKVKCLNLGADDYVTKPFGSGELIARVKAVLRRTETAPKCAYATFLYQRWLRG